MTVVIAQVETRCPHEGCRWTFVGTALLGKAAVPQHLAIAHGGRHPGEQPARAALDAMDAGEPQTPEAGRVEPEAERAAETAAKRSRRPSKWTRETIVAAITAFADERGRTPTARDQAGLVVAAGKVFGSWGDAVEAAGYPRPRRGKTNYTGAGVAQRDRAPADQADDAGSKPAPRSHHDPAAPPEREPTGGETETPSPAAADASSSPPAVPGSSRSDDVAGGAGGALDLATLTNGDAADWITRCDLEAERCTEDAARLVRRASGFKTIGDGLRILQETTE